MADLPQSNLLKACLNPLSKPVEKIPLRLVLIVPFVLLITSSVGVVGYLSYRSGQEAIDDLSNHLTGAVNAQVKDRLNDFLQTQQQAITTTQTAIVSGNLNPANWQQFRAYLWQQQQLLPQLGYNVYANEQGQEIGYQPIRSQEIRDIAEKLSGQKVSIGSCLFYDTGLSKKGWRYYYRTDVLGQPTEIFYKSPIDIHSLPWYRAIKAAGQQTWSPVYIPRVAPTSLSISAGVPLRDQRGRITGVFSAGLSLSVINTFLANLKFSESGQVFILERSGDLIATSTPELPFSFQPGQSPQRLAGIHSGDLTTRTISQHLLQQFGSLKKIHAVQSFDVQSGEQRWFVRVTPYQDRYGLDWLVVVTVPKADFIGPIQTNTYRTIALCALTLGAAIILGVLLARLIDRPIRRLSSASQALANSQWQDSIAEDSPIAELASLSQSFNRTAAQLQQAFDQIKTALQESEQKFTKVFRFSPDPMALLTTEGNYLEVNDSFLQFSEYSREELIGRTSRDLEFSVDLQQNIALFELLQQEGSVKGFEFYYRAKSGRLGVTLISLSSIELEGQPCILAIAKDITDRKILEQELQTSKDRLELVLESSYAAIGTARVTLDRQWQFDYLSSGHERLLGFAIDELKADQMVWFSRIHPEDLQHSIMPQFEKIVRCQPASYEYRFLHKEGDWRWIAATLSSTWNAEGNYWLVTSVAADVSDRKRAEEQLQAALTEKVTLLQEVHHRVKNNLQVICSLLRLQKNRVNDTQIISILEDSNSRILSMALVHQNLYESSNFAQVNLAAYVHDLVRSLIQSYGNERVQTQIQIPPDAMVSLDQAVPCGLILNELITNAFKHGFADSALKGEIQVALAIEDNSYLLSVTNNGKPLPADFSLEQARRSLGIQLMLVLTEQLGGKLKFQGGKQTVFQLIFNPRIQLK